MTASEQASRDRPTMAVPVARWQDTFELPERALREGEPSTDLQLCVAAAGLLAGAGLAALETAWWDLAGLVFLLLVWVPHLLARRVWWARRIALVGHFLVPALLSGFVAYAWDVPWWVVPVLGLVLVGVGTAVHWRHRSNERQRAARLAQLLVSHRRVDAHVVVLSTWPDRLEVQEHRGEGRTWLVDTTQPLPRARLWQPVAVWYDPEDPEVAVVVIPRHVPRPVPAPST